MTAHTKEPWIVADGSETMIIVDGRICAIATTMGDNAKENARRIVVCVNACVGIPTERLESVKDDATPIFELLMKTITQRDELLTAIRAAYGSSHDKREVEKILSAAIDKAEKSQKGVAQNCKQEL